MHGETCYHTRSCPHTSKIHSRSENSPVPTSLLTLQSHIPNSNFIVATAKLVIFTFSFHNSVLSCFILNDTFYLLQQQETLYFGYTNLGSHVPFQIHKSNRSCRQRHMCELPLLYKYFRAGTVLQRITSEYGVPSWNNLCTMRIWCYLGVSFATFKYHLTSTLKVVALESKIIAL